MRTGSSAATVLPSAGVTFNCGSNEVKNVATRSWKPLNTESVTTNAIVATATPMTEMALITLMACVDFFEKRYLRAIKKGKFILLSFCNGLHDLRTFPVDKSRVSPVVRCLFLQQFVNPINVVERVIDEESQLRHDTQLVPHLRTQFVSDGLYVGVDVRQDLLTLF